MTCRYGPAPALAAARVLAVLALAGLCGCAADQAPPPGEPSMYVSMASAEAALDAPAAASMISGYRANNGLGGVTVDPELMKLAEAQARAMATNDKLDHSVVRDFGARIAGYKSKVAAENIGAGYHTLAEAFSGWRDSPPHRQNMLLQGASRIGIAAAYAPKSKYRVFWALILAAPADGRG
ncbi:MAG TPA: CAP domain-containing protein [Xanthobacteraceae bacterium]